MCLYVFIFKIQTKKHKNTLPTLSYTLTPLTVFWLPHQDHKFANLGHPTVQNLQKITIE